MFTKYDAFKIGILLLAFNKWKTCEGSVNLCKDDIDLNFYLPEIGSSQNISICLINAQTLTVELRHNSVVYYQPEGHVHFYVDNLVNRTAYFNFNLKINSSDDYGAWNVKIMSSKRSSLEFTILILQQQAKTELNFSFKTNRQDNEIDFVLICEGTNYPKHIEISHLNGPIIVKNVNSLQNYKKKFHVEKNILNHFQCSSFGSYICSMTDYKNKKITTTLDVFDHHCDPKLCAGNSSDLFTNENSTARLKVCFVHNYNHVNVTIYDQKTGDEVNDPRWSHVYKPRTKFVVDVELTLLNAKEDDFKIYLVVLIFTPEKNLTLSLNIKLKDHPKLASEAWMPKDFCSTFSPRPFFRTVISGLQLRPDNMTNNETQISIIHKYGSSEYYIKIMFINCTQYINESYEVNVKGGSGTHIPIRLDIKEQPVINVSLCNVSLDGSEYFVHLGQSFETEICVNTSHILQRDNIGLNGVPLAKLTNIGKYTVQLNNKTSNQHIVLRFNSITHDDVKMYVVKIKNKKGHDIDFTFFLRLTEGVPVFCNGTRPQITYNVIIGKTLKINLCLQSYPELSSDVVVNGKIYNAGSSSDQVIVHSTFVETSLAYNIELTIQNITCENVGFLNVSFKNIRDQDLKILFILNVTRDLFRIEYFTINGSPNKTLTTQMSTVVLRCSVTSQYNALISLWKGATRIHEERTDQSMYSIMNISCLDTGMYHCQADHMEGPGVFSPNTYLIIQSCPPRLCANEANTRNITVSLDQNVVVLTFCLVASGTINSSVLFKGNEIRQSDCSVCYSLHKNNDSFVDYTLQLRFNNLTTADVGTYILKLCDESNQRLEINISLQLQTNTSQSPTHSTSSNAAVTLVIMVMLVCLTCITVGAILFYRRRRAKKYNVVTDKSYYANISDAQRELITDKDNESNGYTPQHDVILPERDRKFHLPFSRSSFKKKGNQISKSVHFGSPSEGHWTDQSTDVTSIGSTIRLGSDVSSSFSERGVVSRAQSNHCRSASASTEGENWGRYVSSEGLIYLDLSNSDISSNKSKASSKKSQASDVHEKVEYAQLDFTAMKWRAKGKSKHKKENKPKAHHAVNQNVSV